MDKTIIGPQNLLLFHQRFEQSGFCLNRFAVGCLILLHRSNLVVVIRVVLHSNVCDGVVGLQFDRKRGTVSHRNRPNKGSFSGYVSVEQASFLLREVCGSENGVLRRWKIDALKGS